MLEDKPTVVIVGAGFGGLRAARRLRGNDVRVILIDRHNYHLFQPLLYQVATAGLETEQIAKPVRAILRGQRNLEFRLAQVEGVDLAGRSLRTSAGDIRYDYLILAVGGETDTFGKRGVQHNGLALKGLLDAVAIRNRILCLFERAALETDSARRQALLTLVIVGGGPTGVEMAGALSELVHLVLARDLPSLDLRQVSILLLEAADRLLPGMPAPLAQAAVAMLERKGVRVRLHAMVDDYDGEVVSLQGGERIATRTLIWAAGARAAPLVAKLGLPTKRQGRVAVETTLQLPGAPEAFVIGDAAYLEDAGRPLPMLAPVAMQMGETAADNIRRLLRGEAPVAFRYKDAGSLATVGRNAAIAHVRGLSVRGFLAWVVWLVVHLIQLIGFRNRLLVLVNWAVDYFFYDRAVRLITDEDAPC
jgi:NADH:quinone reductase (non-electrogenic)